jgi:hypothetical protein
LIDPLERPWRRAVAFLSQTEAIMTKLKLLGAAAVLSTALATPLMAQEATQEPGAIGFNYPNSHYLTGGYGVHTPYNSGRYPSIRPGYAYYDNGPVYAPGPVGVGPAGVVVGAPEYDPY